MLGLVKGSVHLHRDRGCFAGWDGWAAGRARGAAAGCWLLLGSVQRAAGCCYCRSSPTSPSSSSKAEEQVTVFKQHSKYVVGGIGVNCPAVRAVCLQLLGGAAPSHLITLQKRWEGVSGLYFWVYFEVRPFWVYFEVRSGFSLLFLKTILLSRISLAPPRLPVRCWWSCGGFPGLHQ